MTNGDDLRDRLRRGSYSQMPRTPQGPIFGPQPISQPQSGKPVTEKQRSKKIHFALIFLLIAGGGGAYYYLARTRSNPIPASVQSAVSLPLYFPEKLPEGFSLDNNSYSVDGDIVTFHAVNKEGHKLIFTIQPRPPTFDFPTFYQKGLSGTEQFTTPAGQAAIGKAQTKLIGNLVTEASWIIVSSDTDKVDSSDFRLTLSGLRKAD